MTEIARAADIGQGVVWRFMNDPHKTLTLDTAHALAKAVGIRLTLG